MTARRAIWVAMVVVGGSSGVGAQGVPAARAPMVLPRPEQVTSLPGEFMLADPVRIVAPSSSPRLREIANLLAGVIRARTGYTARVSGSRAPGAIVIDDNLRSTNPEAYELAVGVSGVTIHAASSAGALWGVQTFRQLLPPEFDDLHGSRPAQWTVPGLSIRDAPRFPWRGIMIDAARHFLPVAAVKQQIDVMSRYKLNVLHWHLTDDQGWRIQIRNYPKLTSIGAWRTESDGSRYGGFYTQNEIRDVVEFARLRGVTVVPEIEMPGHSSAALAAHPNLGCTGQPIAVPTTWGVFADIYCPGNERTFTFLTNVLREVIALFPSPYVHIGGDEVPKERWTACSSCQALMRREKLSNETELQSWFVRQIGNWLSQHHRKLIGWDEVLQGGLVKGATVEAWEDTAFTRSAVLAGHDVIAAPGGWTYLDRSPGDLTVDRVYSFDPVPPSVDSLTARHVLGGEAPLWSERIVSSTNLQLMEFPRALALAEALWTRQRDAADFRARVAGDHLARLHAMGVAVGPMDKDIARIRLEYDTVAKRAVVRVDIGLADVVVRGTTDGTAPTATSPVVADSAPLVGDGVHRLQAFYEGAPIMGERVVTLVRNRAFGKPVRVASPPSRQYAGTGAGNLTDGLAGSLDHADGLWQGWLGRDVDVTVDLESIQQIDTLTATFLGNVRSWILMPSRVEFSLSDDGVTWRPIATVENRIPIDRDGAIIQPFEVLVPGGTRARYVRVLGRYSGPLPAWHPGAGRPSWLFVDEIVVR